MFLNKFYKSTMLFMGFLLVCCNNKETLTHNGNDITSFELKAANNAALSKDIKATIDMDAKTVKLTVPSGTDVTALKADFELSEKATASVKGITQKSGVTANDFTNPVTYTITAEDKSTKNYTVTVTKEASSAKNISTFKFRAADNSALSRDVNGTVNNTANTVELTVPSGTNVTALKADFELSAGASAKIGSTAQQSGVTANNFTNALTYTITAEDNSTKNYTVTVTKEASSAKNMSTFKFRAADNSALSRDVNGTVNNTANTVALTVPSGTDVKALKAYFELSAGASAKIGSTAQQSGVTANNFTNALTYTIIAMDNSTKNYTVTVTKEASNAKNISTFKFRAADNSALSRDVNGRVDNTANTVALTVPSGTNVTALKAYFELSAGASAKIGSTAQQSGVTANNFTNALTYTITAVDNSTKNYTVTVTKEASSAKNISTFKFRAADNSALSRDVNGRVDNTANTVALTVPSGTNVTALKAYFELSAGASAKIGSTAQQSGVRQIILPMH